MQNAEEIITGLSYLGKRKTQSISSTKHLVLLQLVQTGISLCCTEVSLSSIYRFCHRHDIESVYPICNYGYEFFEEENAALWLKQL